MDRSDERKNQMMTATWIMDPGVLFLVVWYQFSEESSACGLRIEA
jgi:hypothetical protein